MHLNKKEISCMYRQLLRCIYMESSFSVVLSQRRRQNYNIHFHRLEIRHGYIELVYVYHI